MKHATSAKVVNFGSNLEFTPREFYRPTSENEVLQILDRHRGQKIRVVGRLHSWSPLVETDDVLVSLEYLDSVEITESDGQLMVTIGAGCQIKRALNELAKYNLTLPTVGLISEQTIAGAMATATHGSGRHALGHFAQAMRIAHYSNTGEVIVTRIEHGEELRAAQCSLGMLGIVLSVELQPRAAYRVEERLTMVDTLDDVLASEHDSPLQQFYYLPWLNRFLVQHRCESARRRSWFATLYRIYWFCIIDVGLHLVLIALARWLKSGRFVKWFFRFLAPLTVIRDWRVVDSSSQMLIMEHELFRHLEIELFVTRASLADAIRFTQATVDHFGGECPFVSGWRSRLAAGYSREELDGFEGSYVHHYPVCVRRVLPDTGLMSMTSGGDEDFYAISFITYLAPSRREPFLVLARFLAHSMFKLFQARCHWGKYCPSGNDEISELYPELELFTTIARRFDARGQFTNTWLETLLFHSSTSIYRENCSPGDGPS